MSYDIKPDAVTTIEHIKCIVTLLKQRKIMSSTLSTVWKNTYVCVEHYICATALYLMSILSRAFSVIIDRGISAPAHGREVVDGLNAIYKRFIFPLISTVKLPGEKGYGTQMVMHTGTCTFDFSLAR